MKHDPALWGQAVEACPLPIAFLDLSARYRYANAAYRQMLGRTSEEVEGRTISEVLGATLASEIEPYAQMALSGGSISFDKTILYRRRGIRRMQCQYSAARDTSGETVGFFAYLVDVTDRQESEQVVAEALDGLADGYMALSADLRFTYVNSAAARFVGRERNELLGREMDEVFPQVSGSPSGALVERVLASRHPTRAVVPSVTRPGTLIRLDVIPLKSGGVGVVMQKSIDSDLQVEAEQALGQPR